MNPLLRQFILESRELLQSIAEKLMALETSPDDSELMTELFRMVHTMKGNSGLFEFAEIIETLHAAEDVMDTVREGLLPFSRALSDRLLDTMDFVGVLIDSVESTGATHVSHAALAHYMAQGLRELLPKTEVKNSVTHTIFGDTAGTPPPTPLDDLPEDVRMAAWRAKNEGAPLFRLIYRPEEECFFKGEDPFHQTRLVPGVLGGTVRPRAPWPLLAEMDCYRCMVDFDLLSNAPREELEEHFRYVPEQVVVYAVQPLALIALEGRPGDAPVRGDFVASAKEMLDSGDIEGLRAAAETMLELSSPELRFSSALRWMLLLLRTVPEQPRVLRRLLESIGSATRPDWSDLYEQQEAPAEALRSAAAPSHLPGAVLSEEELERIDEILAVQAEILALNDDVDWLPGRLRACAATLRAVLSRLGEPPDEIDAALTESLAASSAGALRDWLALFIDGLDLESFGPEKTEQPDIPETGELQKVEETAAPASPSSLPKTSGESPPAFERRGAAPSNGQDGGEFKFGRRAEDAPSSRVLKVDQVKVDHLMDLIGEMVVAKNSLPYLANRAENQYGVRELAREIGAQYTVINRIASEMQDSIMQIRMLPLSFIFQRFPRLVRDISRKLGKEIELVLEGEETETDKNIAEALADPLIHIVRNSLDHGLEPPELREAAGKPRTGRLLIRAVQESDRALIEITDDGRGIDPALVKRKAYEKGLIDEERMERITDQEAINLIFAPGFSTVETVSDLSGRGVGMDVVRNALDKVGGSVALSSTVGKGTTLRLSLPLSMAVTNVMIIESDGQLFGIPMDAVAETVRVPRDAVHSIKHRKTAVLRGRIVPLTPLNDLLAIAAEPRVNGDDEIATLVLREGDEYIGLLVDDFREVVDVILKPMPGELAKLACYAGTALLGDGSVLVVLNPKELFR
jgi:two-component system chemotaxis sensor kinase CheA